VSPALLLSPVVGRLPLKLGRWKSEIRYGNAFANSRMASRPPLETREMANPECYNLRRSDSVAFHCGCKRSQVWSRCSRRCRGVAQPGRAPGSGPGGRRFKSSLPDQSFQQLGRTYRFSVYTAVDDFVTLQAALAPQEPFLPGRLYLIIHS